MVSSKCFVECLLFDSLPPGIMYRAQMLSKHIYRIYGLFAMLLLFNNYILNAERNVKNSK